MNLQEKELPFQIKRAFTLGLVFILCFAIDAILVRSNSIGWLDDSIISAIQGMESPRLTTVMKVFTTIGSGTIVAILALASMAFFYFVLGHRRELFLFFGVLLGNQLLNSLAKSIFQRERPTLHRLIEETGYSFPSGHSMGAFSFYGILVYLLWRHLPSFWGRVILIAVGVLMILAIGISRIYLGVHYPSDVAGGYLAAGTWLAIAIGMFQHDEERRRRRLT